MKRGFPQKIEPLLPSCLSRDALNALTALSETNVGPSQSADSVISTVQQIKAEAVASVVRQDDGVDLFEGLIKPVISNSAYQRRVRTSAAVMGLALSMGASDIFSALQTRQAVAAEAIGTADEAQRSAELALELQALAESAQQELETGLYTDSATQVVARAEQSPALAELQSSFPEVDTNNSFHVIQSGETLYGIARSYSVSVDQLASVNGISKSTSVIAGNTLKVPSGAVAPAAIAQVPGETTTLSMVSAQTGGADAAIAELRQRREALRQSLRASAKATEPSVSSAVDLSQLTPYRVKAGDTVDSIARQFSVNRTELLAVNRLENPNVLKVDQNIAIPQAAAKSEPVKLTDSAEVRQEIASIADAAIEATTSVEVGELKLPQVVSAARSGSVSAPSRPIEAFKPATAGSSQLTHRVESGETLAVIARNYGISLKSLSASNRISDPDIIFVGQQLKLPAGATAVQAVAARTQAAPPVSQAEAAKTVAAVSSVDYVDNLMSEIRDLRQKYKSGAPSVAAKPASVAPSAPAKVSVALEPLATKPVATKPEVAVKPVAKPAPVVAAKPAPIRATLPAKVATSAKPQSVNPQDIKVTLPLPQQVALDEPQLVASASLGSQSYEPLAQSILRQSVSPELPPLMSDPFLPGQASSGYIWPAEGVLTSGYGWRWGRMHKGLDIAGPIGTPINAAADGVVTYAAWASGYGNLVEITHPDGSVTMYAHNNRYVVREGERVRQGQHIADMGSTGRSTGPHLHFEIRPSGQGAVNPAALLPQNR